MKLLLKILLVIILIFSSIGILILGEGYNMYKKALEETPLDEKVQEIKSKDIDNIIVELVQYKGKYLLANILVRLGFCLHSLYYILRQRVIYYMSL